MATQEPQATVFEMTKARWEALRKYGDLHNMVIALRRSYREPQGKEVARDWPHGARCASGLGWSTLYVSRLSSPLQVTCP